MSDERALEPSTAETGSGVIVRDNLLRDLQREVTALEDDLRERAVADGATDARLRREHSAARTAGRTAESFESWRDDQVTQSAVAWVLACVFVRFLEDNGLLPEPLISGPRSRRQLALDHRQLFFRAHPTDTDREYLNDVFRNVAKLPASGDVLGDKHNPLWSLAPSGDSATRLLEFFQRVPPETGELAHDFTDPEWNTRFLGDLYQDLSEAARKKFALLQTPEFVEEFILDRTLTPAIAEFGYKEVRLIDPTCGSGHFLLGAFRRLVELHVRHEPGTNPRELAQRALDQVAGIDVNPFAVAIARFRLLLAALKASRIERLADAPGFRIHLAAGDSLLHGRRFGLATMNLQPKLLGDDPLRKHVYEAEDADALKEILGRQYHAVVGNPPYIIVKDKALNEAYRDAYPSCHRQYSMGVPFTERLFELAIAGDQREPAGFVGMITANSFMKREFGKKLIEETLPKLDLTHVIDTSGAYIPGHGTPTVILFGRNRAPVADEVRIVMGIRGEPETPDEPAQGRVWQAILNQLDSPGSESEFISVADYPRSRFEDHPWSLDGGGAAELKELIEAAAEKRLQEVVSEIGFVCMTRADDVYFAPHHALRNRGVPDEFIIENVQGEVVRDWAIHQPNTTLFPYREDLQPIPADPTSPVIQFLWPYRTMLWLRREPNGNHREIGLTWYEWSRFQRSRFRTPLSIAFPFVATHNHFVLDRGGKVFNRTAPVIKLLPNATEDDHLALLAILNSSTACFWMKQTSHSKGGGGVNEGYRGEKWEYFWEFTGTGMEDFPVCSARYAERARRLEELGKTIAGGSQSGSNHGPPSRETIRAEVEHRTGALRMAIAFQEELDWATYFAYGLTPEDLSCDPSAPPPMDCGERAFEVLMARKSEAGELETTWFERHGTAPTTEIPAHWPEEYRRLVDRRIAAIESDRNIGLIEQPEYKRRWNTEPFAEAKQRALRRWLQSRLEIAQYWPAIEFQTTARLGDRARRDDDFMRVAEVYTGHLDFEVAELIRDLVEAESVPALRACRYTQSGLRKREQWERTWELQRLEDETDARMRLDAGDPRHLTEEAAAALKKEEIGEIPVPPKYTSADFLKSDYWGLRGKLDVPKERFVIFPHCEREADPSLVVAWAGWNHLQLAQATAAYYVAMKDTEGWSRERLTPLLAALAELVPWLRQWHDELEPEYGVGMGDYFANFVDGECRSLGLTLPDLTSWTPPMGNSGRRKKRTQRKTA